MGPRAAAVLVPFDLLIAVAVVHHLDFAAVAHRPAELLAPGGRGTVPARPKAGNSPTAHGPW